MKNLIKLAYLNILIFSTSLYAQSIDSINYSAYNYGYSLQKSYSLSPIDMSANVRECKKYNTDNEIYFCIVGSALKTSNRDIGGIEEMKESKNSNMDSFVNERLSFVSNQSYSNPNTEKNKFYVGFEMYKGSGDYTDDYDGWTSSIDAKSYSFNVGYGSGYDSRYEMYLKKTTISDVLDISEYGINWMKPIEKLSYQNKYYPYIKIGIAYIETDNGYYSESEKARGSNIHCDLGYIYKVYDDLEVMMAYQFYSKTTIYSKYTEYYYGNEDTTRYEEEFATSGFSVAINYWF